MLQLAGIGRTPYQDSRSGSGPTRAWPDGNTSLLRVALSKLIPNAFPNVDVGDGPMRPDQLSILAAACRYDQLDRPSNTIRIRLNATVFNVRPTKHRGDYSPVDYVLNRVPGEHDHHRHHHQYGGGGGRRPPPPNMMLNPLMLPPPPNYSQMHYHKYGMSPPSGMVTPMSVAYGGGGGGAESSSEDLNMYGQSSGEHGGGATVGQMGFSKKRFRTKFTTEQKERMMEFAEKLGWRMNKQDEEELKRFCNDIGVKRQVFKVWMHNNKSNAKKPTTTTPGTL